MNEQLERQIRFLRDVHTHEMPHSGHRLLDHLLGTRELLIQWASRPALCDAGLFHSVYGTEHYESAAIPVSVRNTVRELIGEEAESLVWLFCMMRRETFDENLERPGSYSVKHRLTGENLTLSPAEFQDLVTMTFANTLEAFPRLAWNVRRNCRAYLRPFLGVTCTAVRTSFDRWDTRWWEVWK